MKTTRRIHLLTTALALLLFCSAALAETATPAKAVDLPDAETLMARNIEAIGGEEALGKNHNYRSSGTFAIPAMGIEATMTLIGAEPNLLFMKIEAAALGTMAEGCDGEVCWSSSAMAGTQIKEGEERAVALRSAIFNPELNWSTMYDKVEVVDVVEIDGRECYHAVMTPAEGNAVNSYYATDDYLLVKVEMKVATQMGEVTSEMFMSDYRDVDGVKVPFSNRTVLMGGMQEMTMTTTLMEYNVELPEDTFALPEDVKALLPE